MASSKKADIVISSDSSDCDESDQAKVLLKKISELEDANRLLAEEKDRARRSYQEKIDSFQIEIEAMQVVVDVCNESLERHEQKLANREKEDKVQVVITGANARDLYEAMMIFSKVVSKLEQAMEQGPSVGDKRANNDRIVPNDSDVQAIVTAVKAAEINLADSDHVLPAPVVGIPTTDFCKGSVLDNTLVANRNDDIGVVDDNARFVAGKVDAATEKDSDSDSSDADSLIPEGWIVFSDKVKKVKSELQADPRLALKHKDFGPLLQDIVKVQCNRSATYYISKDIVHNAKAHNASYSQYTIQAFEDFFDWKLALYCVFSIPGCREDSFASTLAHFPQEAVDVFLEHCFGVATEAFQVDLDFRQVSLNLVRTINEHLQTVRRLIGIGPSPKDYERYRKAMRLALKRKITY